MQVSDVPGTLLTDEVLGGATEFFGGTVEGLLAEPGSEGRSLQGSPLDSSSVVPSERESSSF